MKSLFKLKIILLCSASASILVAWPPVTADPVAPNSSGLGINLPSDVQQKCVLQGNELPDDWTTLTLPIENATPVGPVYDPNNGLVYVFPPNSPNFVPSAADSNCSFFKWSAQMFNWLTSSIDDKGTASPSVPTSDTPFVFNSEFFYRVVTNHTENSATYPIALRVQDNSKPIQHGMSLRSQKPPNSEDVDFTDQAGGRGVLLSQHYNPAAKDLETNFNSSLVYYSGHVNRTYGYFAQQDNTLSGISFPTSKEGTCNILGQAQTNGYIGEDALSQFLLNTYCGIDAPQNPILVDLEVILDIESGDIISKLEPVVDYLSMTVELKSSWVDASTIPSGRQSRYVLQKGLVPHYKKSDTAWTYSGTKEKTLALVGMHIVGTVKDHPEMIWATYEHMDNAPNAEYAYIKTDGTIETASDLSSTPETDKWLFSDASTTPFNLEQACLESGGSTNENSIGAYTGKVGAFSCTTAGGTLSDIQASNVARVFPWGGSAVTGDAPTHPSKNIENNTSLISLNRSVQASINANNQMDPRQYYFLSGAVWGHPQPRQMPVFPSSGPVPQSELVGTKLIANSTMETFHQNAQGGCFSCHAASTTNYQMQAIITPNENEPPKTVGVEVINGVSVSHIFSSLDPDVPKPER